MLPIRVLALCLAVLLHVPAHSQQEEAEQQEQRDLERLPLAALLIGDGNYRRARNVLAEIDTDDEELDKARYHTLSGLVALNLDELPRAAGEFEAAIEAGQDEPVIWLYLAQAQFGQDNFRETIYALDNAGEQADRLASAWLMRAQSHWELDEYRRAWDALSRGRDRFPDRASDFVKRQVFFLVERGLYQEAADLGLAFLESERAEVQDAIAIGNALRESRRYEPAARILEIARLQAPENVTLAKVLAQVYIDQGMVLSAAEVMARAAMVEPELTAEAAELYRRAGRLVQALMLNSEIIDQEKKLKQRLAIFVDQERFERAAGMHRDLERVGLLSNEDIRYALAYSYFKSGDFGQAEQQLVQLTRSDLFRKATELRRVMEQCADNPWQCG
ncbi:MAG: tetratricopeptide repeat protein [Candidatus Wenzhouxiangella sp. M2_3B_020]